MGLLDKLFGKKETLSPEAEQQKNIERQFNILRDNGVRALKMGEAAMAAPYFENALELCPDNLQVKGYLAEAYLALQDFEKARPILEKLCEAQPDNVETALLLARAQGRTGQYEAMFDTAEKLIAAHADEPRAAYLSAIAAHALHNDIMAIARLTQALTQAEGFRLARRLRAQVLLEMGSAGEALQDTAVLAGCEEADDEDFVLHGKVLTVNAQYDEAVTALTQALELNPFCREAFLQMAKTHLAATRTDEALGTLDAAIGQLPDFAEAYQLRGAIKHTLKDEAGAMEDLKKALELKPAIAEKVDGEFSNLENRLNDQARRLNPYGF